MKEFLHSRPLPKRTQQSRHAPTETKSPFLCSSEQHF